MLLNMKTENSFSQNKLKPISIMTPHHTEIGFLLLALYHKFWYNKCIFKANFPIIDLEDW